MSRRKRWELVELIGQTLLDHMDSILTEDTSEVILDSVESLIRADERDQVAEMAIRAGRAGAAKAAAEWRADLRAKVEALHPDWIGTPDDVLALIDGSFSGVSPSADTSTRTETLIDGEVDQ